VNHYYGGGCWACGGAALAAGAVAGAAAAYAIGSTVATIPPACGNRYVGGVNYFVCGGTWFQPFYGNNGVYYRVVAPL
jgi:ABC-type sugar transport system substrate-binding protein